MPIRLVQVPGFKGIFYNHNNGKYYAIVRYNERHSTALGAFTSHIAASLAFNDEIARLSNRENQNGRWQNSNFVFYKQSSAENYNHLIEDEVMAANQHPDITYVPGFVGVVIHEDQYFALIKIPGKKITVGPFEDLADAAVAHDIELFMQYDEGQVERISALNFPHTYYPNMPDRIALASPEYMQELRRKFNIALQEEDVLVVPAPTQPTSSSAGAKRTLTTTTRVSENPSRFTFANVLNNLGISSVYSGVRRVQNKWDAYFKYKGEEYFLGSYNSEMAAAERYDQEAHAIYKALAANRGADEVNEFYGRFTSVFGVKCNFKRLPQPQTIMQSSSSSSAPMLNQYALSAAQSPNLYTHSATLEPNEMHISPESKGASAADDFLKNFRL